MYRNQLKTVSAITRVARRTIMTNNNAMPSPHVRAMHNEIQKNVMKEVTDMSVDGMKLNDIAQALKTMLFNKPAKIEEQTLGRWGVKGEKREETSAYDHCAGDTPLKSSSLSKP